MAAGSGFCEHPAAHFSLETKSDRRRIGEIFMPEPTETAAPCPDPPLAYRDDEFLDSDEARPLRMLAEYLQPMRIFQREKVRETVVFFGSARLRADGPWGRYYDEARELARRLTEWSLALE